MINLKPALIVSNLILSAPVLANTSHENIYTSPFQQLAKAKISIIRNRIQEHAACMTKYDTGDVVAIFGANELKVVETLVSASGSYIEKIWSDSVEPDGEPESMEVVLYTPVVNRADQLGITVPSVVARQRESLRLVSKQEMRTAIAGIERDALWGYYDALDDLAVDCEQVSSPSQ